MDLDKELLFLMVHASPTLQTQLPAEVLRDLLGPNPDPRSVTAVTRSVEWILRKQVKLRPGAWQAALSRHGWAALAAVVIAVDRQGIRDPAAYLYAMLQSTGLRDTVRHNLRALTLQEAGHA